MSNLQSAGSVCRTGRRWLCQTLIREIYRIRDCCLSRAMYVHGLQQPSRRLRGLRTAGRSLRNDISCTGRCTGHLPRFHRSRRQLGSAAHQYVRLNHPRCWVNQPNPPRLDGTYDRSAGLVVGRSLMVVTQICWTSQWRTGAVIVRPTRDPARMSPKSVGRRPSY